MDTTYSNITLDPVILHQYAAKDSLSDIISAYQLLTGHVKPSPEGSYEQIDAVKAPFWHEFAHQILRCAGGINEPVITREAYIKPPHLFDDNMHPEMHVEFWQNVLISPYFLYEETAQSYAAIIGKGYDEHYSRTNKARLYRHAICLNG